MTSKRWTWQRIGKWLCILAVIALAGVIASMAVRTYLGWTRIVQQAEGQRQPPLGLCFDAERTYPAKIGPHGELECKIDKTQPAYNSRFDSDSDELAVFFGTLGCLLGGLLAYAGLERLCNKPRREKP